MERAMTVSGVRRGLLASVALAALLAAVPLPRLSAAAHDPARSGAGMGTRVPLLLEAGARLGAPGQAAGLARLPAVPGRAPATRAPEPAAAPAARADLGRVTAAVRLIGLGRLQLEGG